MTYELFCEIYHGFEKLSQKYKEAYFKAVDKGDTKSSVFFDKHLHFSREANSLCQEYFDYANRMHFGG